MFRIHLMLALAGSGAASAAPVYVSRPVGFPAGASYLTADGAIRIVGYNDMQGMFEAIDARFAAAHPGFKFSLQLKGTKAAAAALTQGTSALAPMGAEFYESDISTYQRAIGSYPLEVHVAHDAIDPRALSSPIAICVPRSTPLTALTLAQVRRIFTIGANSPAYTTWGQLGLTGGWAGRTIHAYGMSLNTSLMYFMQKHHFDGQPYRPDLAMTYRSQDVVKNVAQDPLGIGISVLNNLSADVKVVGLMFEAGQAPAFGRPEDVTAGRYPYDRQLFIYVRQPVEPWIAEYLRLWLSAEGQQASTAHSPGYLALNDREIAAELAKLDR
jgi:phosphate transport system substrate-binding protein